MFSILKMYAAKENKTAHIFNLVIVICIGDHITMANIFVRDYNIVINIILFLMYSFKEEVLLVLLSFTLYMVI